MLFTAHNDFPEIAQHVLDAVKQLTKTATEKLEKLDRDDEMRDDVKAAKKQAILDDYTAAYKKIRTEYGGKVDARADEIRKLAQKIETPAPNPANAAVLQMLQLAPTVTQPMLIRCAESIGDDAIAQEILMQIANQNGYASSITGLMKTPVRHLRQNDLDEIADGLQSSFMRYFGAHSFYDSGDPTRTPANADLRERTLNLCERSCTAAELSEIAGGSAFKFGGDSVLQSEFGGLANSAEL